MRAALIEAPPPEESRVAHGHPARGVRGSREGGAERGAPRGGRLGELAAVDDLDLLRGLSRGRADLLDGLNDIHAFGHLVVWCCCWM